MVQVFLRVLVLSVLAVGSIACKRANPAVCCSGPTDCAQAGIDEDNRTCASGLACVDNECVIPACSTDGCAALAPVCNVTTDVCEACAASEDCMRFLDQPVCDAATGACVQCVSTADCSGRTPTCDDHACRGCMLDTECASGGCGEDGACVAEAATVYLDPGGADTGTCSKAAPCRTILFAVSQTSATRSHIVMAQGVYTVNASFTIEPQQTTATKLFLHGHDASLIGSAGDDTLMRVHVPIAIEDLNFESQLGTALAIGSSAGPSSLERSRVRGYFAGIAATGFTTLRDVTIEGESGNTGLRVSLGSSLTADRLVIHGYDVCVSADGQTATLDITNALVYDCSTLALDLPMATGSVAFSTIADSGTDSGSGPRAVVCSSAMTFRSSIIWAPGGSSRVPINGCNLVSSIAGPTAVAGAPNTDPMFVDRAARNYHLKANSPARDAVDTGPALDVDGDARPQGARFDIGADEVTE